MDFTKLVFLILFFCFLGNPGFVFSQKDNPPFLDNANQEPIQYCSDPVAVASLISIENLHADKDNKGIKISISNYISGEDTLVYEAIDSFKYSWSQNNGYLEITGIGVDADYEKAVSQVYYQNIASTRTPGIRSISISLRDADYLPSTGHFYRFVKGNWLSWSSASDQAALMNYYGLQGYLVTIRSQEEQDFIMTKTEGAGWIGASDNEREGAHEGTWMWVEGPDSGVVFWSGRWNGSSVNNEYSNWNLGQPDNLGQEDFAHIFYSINKGYWNDLANVGSNVPGYITQGFLIEFGGMTEDPEVKLSAVANIEVREIVNPELDPNKVKTLFCGNMTQNFNIAFRTGTPETKLTPLDSGVIVTDETSNSPSITVPDYGVYYFQLDMEDHATCLFTDTISLEFYKQPEASFNLNENDCHGYTLPLAYTGKSDNKALFTWYYNEEEFLSGIGLDSINIKLDYNELEHIVGLIINDKGCINSNTLPIKVKPYIDVIAQNSEGCSPLTVSFVPSSNEPIQDYIWDFGDGTSSVEQNPTHTFVNNNNEVHSYNITLTVRSQDGCESISAFEDLVMVHPVPTASFNFEPKEVSISDPNVVFNNTTNSATSFFWDFGDSTAISDLENPIHRYDAMGVYHVVLEAYSEQGCKDSTVQQVKVAFERLFPPNAFSPNAPLEEDREFRLYGEGVAEDLYQLLIFNRWGELIFESDSQEKGWDGKMKNSEFAPAGVYTWVLEYADFSGQQRKQQGIVTLIF